MQLLDQLLANLDSSIGGDVNTKTRKNDAEEYRPKASHRGNFTSAP